MSLQRHQRGPAGEENALQRRLRQIEEQQSGARRMPAAHRPGRSELVRYTPTAGVLARGPGGKAASSRLIRLTDKPVDPMVPQGFKTAKTPRLPGSPPAPVLHSPPRKLTSAEAAEWAIPPCVSSWKNARGYVIPLDKRLAADGRGLQEVSINDNFAKLSEALYVADRHAREEVRLRAEMQARLVSQQKEAQEEQLRELAALARESRPSGTAAPAIESDGSDLDEMTAEERRAFRERENLRRERQQQRARELRLSHMGSETKARVMDRLRDRDVSERIALGASARPAAASLNGAGDDQLFDQRLFNRSEGLASGFGAEDGYAVYDKPLFTSASSVIHSAMTGQAGAVADESGAAEGFDPLLRAQPGLGFESAKGSGATDKSGAAGDARVLPAGPVEFERDESDPFGTESFMASALGGKKR